MIFLSILSLTQQLLGSENKNAFPGTHKNLKTRYSYDMIYFHIKKQRNANWSAIAPRSSQRHFIVSKEILPEQAGEEPRTIVFEAVYYRRTTRIERDEQRDGISWRKGLH